MRLDRMTAVVVLAVGLASGGVLGQSSPDPVPPPDVEGAPRPRNSTEPLRQLKPKPKELGVEHKRLSAFAGSFKSKMQPVEETKGPAPDGAGTAEGKLLMDGRFVQITHKGVAARQPYEEMHLIGYDTITARYTAVRIDTVSSAMVRFVGAYDAAKKQISMSATYSDQTTHRLVLDRIVLTAVDESTWTYDEYTAHSKGEKETHTLSVTFKRG